MEEFLENLDLTKIKDEYYDEEADFLPVQVEE